MIRVGERVPDATVWLAPRRRVRVSELALPGEAILLLFYLFDWSST